MTQVNQPKHLNSSSIKEYSEPLSPISQRYLLAIHIPIYCDGKGLLWLDQMWHKDLIGHLNYLEDFTLVCPCKYEEPPEGSVLLNDKRVKLVTLPSPNSLVQAILLLPITIFILWQAIGRAEVVHSGLGGWLPISLENLVALITKLRKRFYFINVESATWRLLPGQQSSIKNKIKAVLSEKTNRFCLGQTDLATFTQEEYKRSLLPSHREHGYIIHASWIDEEAIFSKSGAIESWGAKLSQETKEIKVLFVGRLTISKGVLVLLEAIKLLDEDAIPVKLDILGQGELLEQCKQASKTFQGSTRVDILGVVPYGTEFFQLLRNYHIVVVPSIADEQPRIVYDAYSQAIPLLASDTDGLRDCIYSGKSGVLTSVNDPVALANSIEWSLNNLTQLQAMGIKSLEIAHNMTHQEMHRKRWRLLSEKLS